MRRRVLLVGATGVFGSRLATLLAADPRLEIVLAARGKDALARLHQTLALDAQASLQVRSFDRARPADLNAIGPWLTIDAAGPFEGDGYELARAAVGCGSHYVDLADGRGFVAGFVPALDSAAKAADVVAVTGASSTPALSQAAFAALTAGWSRLDRAVVVISPGARAPRGLSVMASILGYAGQPVLLFRGGAWSTAPGWSGLRRVDMPELGQRWASLCETPDLDLLPKRFPIGREALFLAGLELSIMHLGLAALCLPVRWRLLTSLRPLARPLLAVASLLAPFGTDRGGMIVEAEGEDAEGLPIRARWALWADRGAGPSTPAAPAAALVHALLADMGPPRGAMTCTGLLPLPAIMHELAGLPIATRIDESHPASAALFRRLLGRRFGDLPLSVQAVHRGEGSATFQGHAAARAGRGLVARVLRMLVGWPPTGRTAVAVRIAADATGETWVRRFGPSAFTSRLVGTPRLALFEERFGPLRFTFHLQPDRTGVIWTAIGWCLLGVPLPFGLAPRIRARAEDVDGRYRFRVAVRHRWTGLLFAYRGHLS